MGLAPCAQVVVRAGFGLRAPRGTVGATLVVAHTGSDRLGSNGAGRHKGVPYGFVGPRCASPAALRKARLTRATRGPVNRILSTHSTHGNPNGEQFF